LFAPCAANSDGGFTGRQLASGSKRCMLRATALPPGGQVVLEHRAIVVDDEARDAAAMLRRPGNQRKPANHAHLVDVVVGAPPLAFLP
jgi:hypothetical protein